MAQEKEYTISDLSPKQQTLLNALIDGKSKPDAYREAYPDSKVKDMTRQVNKMINNEGGKYPKFSPVYARAREEAKKKAEAELEKHIINRVELLAYLTDIFMDPNASTRDKIKAGELLAKLLGLYESRLNVNMNANPFAKLTTEELQKLAGEQ